MKVLQSDWLNAFWLIAQEPEFSQIWDLCRHKVNNMNFHLKPYPEKSNEKKFGKNLKTTYFSPFWTHFADFLGKKEFS